MLLLLPCLMPYTLTLFRYADIFLLPLMSFAADIFAAIRYFRFSYYYASQPLFIRRQPPYLRRHAMLKYY